MLKKSLYASTFAILLIILLLFSFVKQKERQDVAFKFPEISHFPKMPKAKKNLVTVAGVELGRYLFYDPILSLDSSISCASCHRQEHAFTYNPTYKSSKKEQRLKTRRNIMPLFNLAWSHYFFWDGRVRSIEEQAYHPVRTNGEMNCNWPLVVTRLNRSAFYKSKFKTAFGKNHVDSELVVKAIAQFERTLLSYNSKFDRVARGESAFTEEELEGYKLIEDSTKGNCLSCHTLDVVTEKTSKIFSNNGINKPEEISEVRHLGRFEVTKKNSDKGKFKIPTLRNLFYTAPYMHDGRYGYLAFVINHYSETINYSETLDKRIKFRNKKGANLTPAEKRKIESFLTTLNDSSFVHNPAFSNPFLNKESSR